MALMVEVVGRLGTISVSVSSLGTWATSPFLFGNGLGLEGCELDLQLIYWERSYPLRMILVDDTLVELKRLG